MSKGSEEGEARGILEIRHRCVKRMIFRKREMDVVPEGWELPHSPLRALPQPGFALVE